jgi:hypothetical protein
MRHKLRIALFETHPRVRHELESELGELVEFVSSTAAHPTLAVVSSQTGQAERTVRLLGRLRETSAQLPLLVLAWESSERLAIAALKLA